MGKRNIFKRVIKREKRINKNTYSKTRSTREMNSVHTLEKREKNIATF